MRPCPGERRRHADRILTDGKWKIKGSRGLRGRGLLSMLQSLLYSVFDLLNSATHLISPQPVVQFYLSLLCIALLAPLLSPTTMLIMQPSSPLCLPLLVLFSSPSCQSRLQSLLTYLRVNQPIAGPTLRHCGDLQEEGVEPEMKSTD